MGGMDIIKGILQGVRTTDVPCPLSPSLLFCGPSFLSSRRLLIFSVRALRCVMYLDGVPQYSLVLIIWQMMRFGIAGLELQEQFRERGELCVISSLGVGGAVREPEGSDSEARSSHSGCRNLCNRTCGPVTTTVSFCPKAGSLFS